MDLRLAERLGKLRVQAEVRGIVERRFSLIASSCTGTLPYRFLDVPYASPTVNLFLFAVDYVEFAARLAHYLAAPLEFVRRSRHAAGRATHAAHERYPIGLLDGSVEIHFMHYGSEAEARAKWTRRCARVELDRLVFSMTDRDGATPELMERFDALPHRRLLLTARPMPWLASAVAVPHWRGRDEIGDAYTRYDTLAHVSFRALIDGPPVAGPPVAAAALPRLPRTPSAGLPGRARSRPLTPRAAAGARGPARRRPTVTEASDA